MARYEVTFTVYNEPEQRSYDTTMYGITTIVECFMPQQAQQMVEAQYRGCAHVHSVRQV